MLRARLFGPLLVEIDGRPVPEVDGLKPRSVLAWLLLHPGPHARARLAARFWPDVLDTSARASLRNALWTIRRALEHAGGSQYLVADRESAGISAELPSEIDVGEFERLAASGDADALGRAVALAEAPLCADLADDWVLEARDEYRERAADLAFRLADAAEAAGDGPAAVGWTRRALRLSRFNEAGHRALMRRLVAVGEPAEALRAYARLRASLGAEFGTGPSPETRALAAEVRRSSAFEDTVPLLAARVADAGREAAPLVGRDAELAALQAAWSSARAGSGGVVVVSGGPGIGKSRLASALCASAVAEGALVAVGAALDIEASPPLAAWAEAIEAVVAGSARPPDGNWPAELARLCPSVERVWGVGAAAAALDPGLERSRLFGAITEAIEWAAAARPVLLVLEDLHLADEETVALLARAGRRLGRSSVLVLVTRRPVARNELELALHALERHGALGAPIELAPLGDAEIRAIVDAVTPLLPPERRRLVLAAAEGVPFLACEAARAAAGGGEPTQGLRAWIRASLARLPGPARLLVDLAATVGRPLELGEAADLIGAEALADALAACEGELLALSPGRRVAFVHDLVREACYAELDAGRRLAAHGQVAAALRARPRPAVAEIARHLLAAGEEGEARAYLAAAAANARRVGALEQAGRFLREAADLAGGTGTLAAELWLAVADLEAVRGNRTGHDDAFQRTLAALGDDADPLDLAAAYAERGRCLRTTLCYPHDALRAYEHALAIVDEHLLEAPELRALALAGLAWAEAASGDTERAEALIRAAEALPETGRDQPMRAELAIDRGTALVRAGRLGEAEQACESAAALALEAGRVDLAYLARNLAASAAATRGDFAAVLGHVEQARRAGRGGSTLEAEALAARAYALARLGRHVEAEQAASEEEAVLAGSGDAREEALGAFDAGSIALAGGRFAEAAERLGNALEEEGGRFPRALARLRLAEAVLAAGDVAGAAEELARFPFEPVAAADVPETLVPRLERLQGLAAAARGDRALALRRLAEAEAGWRRLLTPAPGGPSFAANLVDLGRAPVAGLIEPGVELGRVLAERAVLLAEEGRVEESAAALEEAAGLAAEHAFEGYAEALVRARDLTSAAQSA